MATSTASNGIVHEALTKDNYETWSILVKNYLMSQDLWDDVIEDHQKTSIAAAESSTETTQCAADAVYKKKNAKALHIIQMSCGSENLSKIKETTTAKSAWNTLASLFKPGLRANPDIEQGLTLLHRSVQRGDWDAARSFMTKNRREVYQTSKSGKTVLHIAVLAGRDDIVKKLAKEVPKRLLEERDTNGYTPLALAAYLTDTNAMAECMVDRSEALLSIKTNEGFIPVVLAAIKGHKAMTRYLYGKTPRHVINEDDGRISSLLLTKCITSKIFDVALDLLQRNPRLPLFHKFEHVSPLYALALHPSAFPSGSPPNFWLRWIYNCITRDTQGKVIKIRSRINEGEQSHLWQFLENGLTPLLRKLLGLPGIRLMYEKKLTHFRVVEIVHCMAKGIMEFDEKKLHEAAVYESLLEASRSGIVEFIKLFTEANPDLYWVIDENRRGIFSYAILNRRENIFNLIDELKGAGKVIISSTDVFDNNMLHFTGMPAPLSELDRRSGPALQMQRELQWFKEVKKILHPKFQRDKNTDGMKPHELFTKKHEVLVKEGETWAKETATSFTIVGTLMITMMFAAAFTVPGGNKEDGTPLFLNERMFTVFIVADALSLFTSSTSVMMFINILTSRYAEKDFLISLPLKLMFGLFTLICSVLTMMLTFCAALSLMLRGHFQVVIVAISIASVSIILFLPLQLRLLLEIFSSTFRSEIGVRKNQKF